MSHQSTIPNGIKLENTSFGQNAKTNTYTKPQFTTLNNPVNTQKAKPRGGWDDDDEPTVINSNNQSTAFGNKTNAPIKPNFNANTNNNTQQSVDPSKKFEIKTCDDTFFNTYEYENKIIQEAVQPNGARLKQSDIILNEFCKACESLPVEIVGSILFYNLSAPIVWPSKAKTIFAIEALVKKISKYHEFFKFNIIVLKSKKFLEEGLNAAQLKKALDDVINFIEGKTPAPVLKTPQQMTFNQSPIQNIPQIVPNKQTNANPTIIPKQETKAQPQKLNPFNIPSSNPTPSTTNTTTTTKSSGLPGAFKNSTNNSLKSVPKSTSSVSSQDETPNHHSNGSTAQIVLNQPASATSLSNTTKPTNNTSQMNSIMESLSGLDFSDNAVTASPQNSNNIYNLYPQQSNGMSNGSMPYGQDPNMGGFNQQPFYPYPQYNSGFNGGYNPQMYSPQFQGQGQFNPQYNQQYNPQNNFQNYPMQGFQGQQEYPQYYDNNQYSPCNQNNQYGNQNSQQVDQADEFGDDSNGKSILDVVQNEEQERLKQEELMKKKKQEEIESKFDNLKYLL